MFCIGVYFINTVTTLFGAYIILFLRSDPVTRDVVIWSCCLSAFVTIAFIILIALGSWMCGEGKNISLYIHIASTNIRGDPDISMALIRFSQQISHVNPAATCGLFSFDWDLLSSIIAGLFAYIIILIQFEST